MTASTRVATERLPHYSNQLVASTACSAGPIRWGSGLTDVKRDAIADCADLAIDADHGP